MFNRRGVAGNFAENELAIHNPITVGIDEVIAIDSGDLRSPGQELPQRWRPEFPVDAGGERANPRAPAVKLLQQPAREVVRHRLDFGRSEEHTSELQSQSNLVCRL